MNRILLISVLAVLSTSPAFAADGGGHGGGGGGHGGDGYGGGGYGGGGYGGGGYGHGGGGWQRGGGWGGGWDGGWIGPALVDGAIIDDMTQPEPVYVQQPIPVYSTSVAPQVAAQFWYFCAAANAYYPYVSSCPSGWQTVPATPPIASPSASPRAPVPAPVSKTLFSDKPITIKGANFARGSAELQPAAYEQLDAAVEFAEKNEDATLTVAGYTDSRGNEKANLILSARRAESVKAYLVKQGVDADRIITAGKGSANPVGDNSTPQGRAENRRVEINFVERATR